jgi:hypothetical protein
MEKIKSNKRSDTWIIKNNGDIVYPYLEAEKKGVGRREFRNAIDELIEKGFIDITHQGSGGRSGDMTKYYIDDRWKEYATASFRPARKARKKDSRKGRGWSVFHAKRKQMSVTKTSSIKSDSSDKSVTPKNKQRDLSSNNSATSKIRKKDSSICNCEESRVETQLSLWSDKIDTIL